MIEKNGFILAKSAIPKTTCSLLSRAFRLELELKNERINKNGLCKVYNEIIKNKQHFVKEVDQGIGTHDMQYAYAPFESLMVEIQPIIEQICDKKLYPTYSLVRIYQKGNKLIKHTDRPSCEYSVTACIDNIGGSWAIWVEGYNGEEYEVFLEPGDILVYKGCDLVHWRDVFEGQEQMQCFMHYVDKDGPNASCKWDFRNGLGREAIVS